MNIEVIGADEVRARLSMLEAIDALNDFFADPGSMQAAERAQLVPRLGTDLLIMPAWDRRSAGVKLLTINPDNEPRVNGLYCLFDEDLIPTAVIEAASLTALRTAAVSGLATRLMSRDVPSKLVVFGAGVQARAHIEAMSAVRPIEEVIVIAPGGAEDLAGSVGGRAGSPEDVASADIVCTCTTSPVPVLDGSLLRAGVHINAIGAHKPDERELDDATIARARIVVEDLPFAKNAGDLRLSKVAPQIVADLFEAAKGAEVRSGPDDITIFKSVGIAYEDLVIARAIAGAS